MSEEAEVSRKAAKAFQMLAFQRHRYPGVKGWELKKAIGKDFVKIIEIMNSEVERLGLKVGTVYEEGDQVAEPSPDQLESARFFLIFKSPPSPRDVEASGLRIDDLAVLAASIAYVTSRHGKTPRKDLEQLLREKFPRWKVELNLDRFIRRGYLMEDKDELVYIGWRTKAEVDQKTLLSLVLSAKPPNSAAKD